jgi:thioredoxin 1
MGVNTIEITDANFNTEVLQSNIPVLVDFWAEWCGPCKALAPTIEAVALDYQGKVKIGKMNIDLNMGIPSRYNIKGIPTLLLFKDGMVQEQLVGVPSNVKDAIVRLLDKHL